MTFIICEGEYDPSCPDWTCDAPSAIDAARAYRDLIASIVVPRFLAGIDIVEAPIDDASFSVWNEDIGRDGRGLAFRWIETPLPGAKS